jgi:hypothetical protein
MKKSLLLTGVLLALTASLASAAGLQLGWSVGSGAGTCPFNSLAGVDYTDPCDGTGFQHLVGACNVPSGLTAVTGEDAFVDMTVADATLPPFWHLETGGCGDGAILMQAVFTGFATGTTATTCRNYWGTSASGGFSWKSGYGAPNRARLEGVFARTSTSATAMIAGANYYIFDAILSTTQADPLGANCAGCQTPACWVFNELVLSQPVGVGDADITTAATRNFVTWQGGAGVVGPNGQGCPLATPATHSTWGKVKSLYR